MSVPKENSDGKVNSSNRPPSVDAIARSLADTGLPHRLIVSEVRAAIAAGDYQDARARLQALADTLIQPVINATGVLLHTNLGRAPVAAMESESAVRYSNLEYDLAKGERGSRHRSVSSLLATATGAEAAIVVNNGASAVLLVLVALATRSAAIVSRGELLEIGGGFRIPEVMEASGTRLIEVGTTNKTHLSDYENAIDEETAVILQVHRSNFAMTGFVESVATADLAKLTPLLVADLGSGLLDATCPWLADGPPAWLAEEPAVRQTLAAGADVVIFSGDKLLGGPQAGIIVGRKDLIDKCARHPLARALRPGSRVLVDLQATVLSYLHNDSERLPLWEMATRSVAELEKRAIAIGIGEPASCTSVMGGGSLPGAEIPSFGLQLRGDVTAALRSFDPPVIARVHEGHTVVDLRTVDPHDDQLLAQAISSCTS